MRLISLLFTFLFCNSLFAQNSPLNKKQVKKIMKEMAVKYKKVVRSCVGISCPQGVDRNIDYKDIINGLFTENATIETNSLNNPNILSRNYLSYFERLATLCRGGLYVNVNYSIEEIGDIPDSDIEANVEGSVYIAKVKIKQEFKGVRSNGTEYCDITIKKIFVVIVKQSNNVYSGKISKVKVEGPAKPCF